MIVGIGTDIVEVQRFSSWLHNQALLNRFFHADEVEYIRSNNAVQTIAARFAAKEAFVKALGTGFRGITLSNICTKNNEYGKPYIVLYDDVEELYKASGANKMHITLSHEKKYASAFVVLECV